MPTTLPDHLADCRPRQGYCAPDCPRYDALAAAQYHAFDPDPWEEPGGHGLDMMLMSLLIGEAAIAFALGVIVGIAIGATLT